MAAAAPGLARRRHGAADDDRAGGGRAPAGRVHAGR